MFPQSLNKTGRASLYHFGDNNFEEMQTLFDKYEYPKKYLKLVTRKGFTFGLAGTGTGVPFHTHGAVFAETIYGRKRWFLSEPNKSPKFDKDENMLTYFRGVYSNLSTKDKPLSCVCDVGDLIYVPSNWDHATLNIGQIVFVSIFL